MNFFRYRTVAERYAKYRPYFHPLVIEKIKSYLNVQRPVGFALDIGCGSGQSTVALRAIASLVAGVDISAEMLRVAQQNSGNYYILAAAEKLAITSNSCDLLTTFLAYHWFDQEQFFAEARRVLKDGAWLIISNNGFRGQMRQKPEFERWVIEVYENRYPMPPRNSAPMSQAIAQTHGFNFAYQEEYQNEVHFNAEELAAYLSTQSNVIAATEEGNEKVEEVHEWLITQTRSLFNTEKAAFPFGGFIWYLQKIS